MRFYVQTPKGKPLGVIEAPDALVAQQNANVMWGHGRAYAFPESHTSWSERLLARVVQAWADEDAQ